MYRMIKNRRTLIKQLLVIAGVILAGLCITILGYRFLKNEPANLVIPVKETSGADTESNSKKGETNEDPNTINNSSDKVGQNDSNQNMILKEPSGVFVSNHRPSLSNSELRLEQSVCNTTPGATCYIQFTKSNLIRKLPAQKSDSDGNVYWTWDIKDAQLSEGSWKITAIATLGDQTKTMEDPIPLEVQP